MPERICKSPITYAGRDVTVGEKFNVEDKDVDLLLKIGRIEPVEGEPGYISSAMSSGGPSEYRTRDMRRKKRFG